MKKVIFSILSLFIVTIIQFDIADAGRGCCSWHGGQDYCDTNSGRWVCNDGTYSPSCTCSTYQQPSTPTYNNYITPTVNYYTPPVQTYTPSVKTIPSCSKYPGTVFEESTNMCICENGNSYNFLSKSCETMDQTCNRKYPSTKYSKINNMCLCENGNEYSNVTKSCETKDQMCDRKYPGTSYNSSDDMCICGNGNEFSEKENKCTPIPKCYFSNNTTARVGEFSSQGSYCNAYGVWVCQRGRSMDKITGYCISPEDIICQSTFGAYSSWTFQYDSNNNLLCSCFVGYEMVDKKCIQKQ